MSVIFTFQSQPPEQSGGVVTRRSSKVSQHSVSMDSGMRRMSIHEGVKIKLICKFDFFLIKKNVNNFLGQ